MARCAIAYATKEGHTAKIAARLSLALRAAGLEVDPIDVSAAPADFSLEPYDAALVCAPIHIEEYPPHMIGFARRHAEWLAAHPSAFVSVSLAALGTDEEDIEGLAHCVSEFAIATGWQPARVEHVAGALVFSQYPFFVRQVMKAVARQHNLPANADTDLTDYARLEEFAREFAATVPAS
ncbi:MAG: flavodoxin domain-containing protein [Dehalococcoidia bacterium]|nr:flavodoxin domain-containing protein [Dehalococcoidia bacterium]